MVLTEAVPHVAERHIGGLVARFRQVRAHSLALTAAWSPEDMVVQSMPDASPAKWHLAHTTWFFETFLLAPLLPGYRLFRKEFGFLFNSYYESLGTRYERPRRGLLTRPSLVSVMDYRAHVDAAMEQLMMQDSTHDALVVLGLQHEQQHQELLLADMLHALSCNPLRPVLQPGWAPTAAMPGETAWLDGPEELVWIGHEAQGFAFDNETPRHRHWLAPFRIADRLVRNAEWLAFMRDGGYRQPLLWMSTGWDACQGGGWNAPLYWFEQDGNWMQFTPAGVQPVDPAEPVRHVSWHEADAFARWCDRRLPTEQEWEAAAALPGFHEADGLAWQWTGSAYRPYPGFRPAAGAVGEYNGKFMINQMVLRGGSCATPPGHARRSYRNFFSPDARWQFSGLRLAMDVA